MPTAVVVGGGYAGVQSARILAKNLSGVWTIQLITRSNCHELITRLPEVAAGRVHPDKACIPYSRILPPRVEVSHAEIVAVKPDEHILVTADGQTIQADRLLLATGSRPDHLGIPGASDFSLPLKTVKDAVRLHSRLAKLRQTMSSHNFAIIGAGYTGTELCGELLEHARSRGDVPSRVTVIAEHTHLMPEGNPHLASLAEHRLRRRGTDFRLGRTVQSIEVDRIVLAGGEYISCDVAVWAAHSLAAVPGQVDQWHTGRDFRIQVDPFLRAVGLKDTYVAGDCALAYDFRRDSPVASSAQLAIQEGTVAANNLAADCGFGELREFVPHVVGEAISLGPGDGVAEIAGVTLTRRFAAAAKRGALVRYLSSFRVPGIVRDYA